MITSLRRLIFILACALSVLALVSFLFEFLPSRITAFLLFGSIITTLFQFLISDKYNPFFSPLFYFSLVFFILLLLGTFLFSIIYGRQIDPQIALNIYATFLALFLGAAVGQSIFSKNLPLQILECQPTRNASYLVLICIMGFTAFTVMILLRGVPIFAADINAAKVNFYSGLGHLNTVYRIVPVISLALIADAHLRNDRRRLRIAYFIFSILIFTNILTGFRSLVFKNIISYLTLIGVLGASRFSNLRIIILASAGIIMASAFGAYRRGNSGLEGLINEIFITVGARVRATELIFTNLGSLKGLEYSYFGDIAKLLPGSRLGQNAELKFQIFSGADSMPELAGINPSIVGEALMIGGRIGVVVGPFFWGFSAGFLFWLASTKKDKIIWLLLYVMLIPEFIGAIASGIGTRLPSMIIQVVLVTLVAFLYQKGRFARQPVRYSEVSRYETSPRQ